MQEWPVDVEHYTADEVEAYVVRDLNWQAYRQSLKGLPTSEKLRLLHQRLKDAVRLYDDLKDLRRFKVQIDNYLNALKRAGELDMNLKVAEPK